MSSTFAGSSSTTSTRPRNSDGSIPEAGRSVCFVAPFGAVPSAK